MCLRTVTRRLTKLSEKSGQGYKVFRRTPNGRLKGQLFHKEATYYKCRVWYTAQKGSRISASDGNGYAPGFHIFTKLSDAQRYAGCQDVHLVEYRKARCIGKQSLGLMHRKSGECVIAGEMRIIKKVKKSCMS